MCYTNCIKFDKGVSDMGLVTKRNDRLEKLFDGFAVDPSKLRSAHQKEKSKDEKKDQKSTKHQ